MEATPPPAEVVNSQEVRGGVRWPAARPGEFRDGGVGVAPTVDAIGGPCKLWGYIHSDGSVLDPNPDF